MRLESRLSRMNCQTFSTGLAQGIWAAAALGVMLAGMSSHFVSPWRYTTFTSAKSSNVITSWRSHSRRLRTATGTTPTAFPKSGPKPGR